LNFSNFTAAEMSGKAYYLSTSTVFYSNKILP